jgi:hypothetical protein
VNGAIRVQCDFDTIQHRQMVFCGYYFGEPGQDGFQIRHGNFDVCFQLAPFVKCESQPYEETHGWRVENDTNLVPVT